MVITGRQIIQGAMRAIGASAAGETPDGTEFRDCFQLLNQLLDDFKNDRLLIPHTTIATYTLSAGVARYTIGPGGDFDTIRPQVIDAAAVYPDPADAREVRLEVYAQDRWARVLNKTMPGAYPRILYYDHAYSAGLGAIDVSPVPETGTVRLVLWTPQPLGTFATLDTSYDLAPGMARLLRLNLAVEIAPEFPGSPQDTLAQVAQLAREAKASVRSANLPERELELDPAFRTSGSRFDIRSLD